MKSSRAGAGRATFFYVFAGVATQGGHEIVDVEDIVESNDRFSVVAKLGVAGQTAMKLDPRSRN